MTDQRLLVSVVDDDASVRESLPDLLGVFGFAARVFSSAEEFLESGYVDKTRCLILDIAMPGMTGPDLQQELKNRGQEHSDRLYHRAWRPGDSLKTARNRCGRMPVQAI